MRKYAAANGQIKSPCRRSTMDRMVRSLFDIVFRICFLDIIVAINMQFRTIVTPLMIDANIAVSREKDIAPKGLSLRFGNRALQ